MKKRLLMFLMAGVLFAASLTGCDDEDEADYVSEYQEEEEADEEEADEEEADEDADVEEADAEDGSWAVYWYLCGSDLESNYGFATTDLAEAAGVDLPDNVTVVVQTGGASEWQNDIVSADSIGRYVISDGDLEQVDELEQASMGDSGTLSSFLKFCNKNYPADHKMVVLWDHGGGSTSGAALDENFDDDYLSIPELRKAFKGSCKPSKKKPPYDIIGFDTCLMSTVDVANIFQDIGKYLVASEETEPGLGWAYDGWLGALAEDTSISPKNLGKVICDTYYEACEEYDLADEVTLAVTDLSKVSDVVEAYNMLGTEALINAVDDSAFFADFGRAASSTENYGGNTDKSGYSDMADLGDLTKNSKKIMPETSQALLDAIKAAVVYQVKGEYRSHATGLSCYYSYSGNTDLCENFEKASGSKAFEHFYHYGLTGELSDEGYQYLLDLAEEIEDVEEIPEKNKIKKKKPSKQKLEDHELKITDDNYAVLNIGAKEAALLSEVNFELAIIDDDTMVYLGSDNDIDADWEKGVFKDNFRGVWGSIDDHLVYMEVVSSNEDYTTYSTPIKLNGEEYNLRVIYDYNKEKYEILGARKETEDDGMADKDLVKLKPGDKITTLHWAVSLAEDDPEPVEFELDTFKVKKKTKFKETDLGDGTFALIFEMVDSNNKTYTSEAALFTIEDGEMEYLE